MMQNPDEYWIHVALQEAEKGMQLGELPIASILVAGEVEISRAHSQQIESNSIMAHAEWFTLHEARDHVWSAPRPLVLYTTVEPCLMCLGAALLTKVDRIVFAMYAAPNGSIRYIEPIQKSGQSVPQVIGGVLENEEVKLMKCFLETNKNFPRIEFVRSLLLPYEP